MRALTEKEQEFAAKNHKLVYTYLHKRSLDVDEFYDVIIFGYLRAVAKYHDRKDLKKYSFSTVAWRCMDSSFGNHCTSIHGKRNRLYTDAIRLDDIVPNAESLTFGEIIPSADEVHSQIEYAEFFRETVTLLPLLQRKVLLMKLEGYGKREIKQALKISV